jgi:ABC-type sugar transport system substrate-binding protein
MIKFLADEDFNNRIVRGLLRRQPNLDILRVQDTPMAGAPDAAVLDWAAQQPRVLLTHDVSTMTKYAYQRLQSGRSMAGIIEVPQSAAIGQIIDDLILIAGTSVTQEYENRVEYLPL